MTEQEQIAMLSLSEKERDWNNQQRGYVKTMETGRVSASVQTDGVITGTFTGTSIQTTMPIRKGKGLTAPGIRIFDAQQRLDVLIEQERKRLESLNKQTNNE